MRQPDESERPVVGITCDVADGRAVCPLSYVRAVEAAGGRAVLLAPGDDADRSARLALHAAHAFVFSGGDDPATEPFGCATHPAAKRMNPLRQAFEVALLRLLAQERPDAPVLGVCLGMQLMALVAGGELDQHMPDSVPSHGAHAGDRTHPVAPVSPSAWLQPGTVTSRHRQAVRAPGHLRVVARAPDGVIEAIDDPTRAFYRGVQWHPERTADDRMGLGVYRSLVETARARTA